jgi:MoxR-like ATPase
VVAPEHPSPAPPAPAEIAAAGRLAEELVEACGRAVRAPHAVLEAGVACLLSGGHLLIEDAPGVGKTVLAKALARAAGCSYARVQCTADLLPADVTGVTVWHQGEGAFRFHPGPVFANFVLVDEVNRASPKTQSALLECMEERHVTVDGTTRPVPEPFMVIATQNPVEYEGTFPLPEAQLDRFALRVSLGYPSAGDEAAMILDLAGHDPIADVPVVAGEEALVAAQAAVVLVHTEPALAEYVVAIARATRQDARVDLGASPRAALSLLRVARARALVHGRPYAMPEDVRSLARMALSHRLLLTPDARARAVDPAEVVEDALRSTAVPLA